jgi:hypothetical protein
MAAISSSSLLRRRRSTSPWVATSSTPSPISSSSLRRLATLVAASSYPTRPARREPISGSMRAFAITRSKLCTTSASALSA